MENPGRMTGRTVQKNPKSAVRQKTGSILADGEQGEAERFDERQAKKVCAGAKEPDPAEHKELEQANPAVRRKQRGGLFRRIWERIRAFFAGLIRKLRQFRAGIKEALKKIKDVRTFLTDERHREVLPLIFTELKYLLTHFKFRRIQTDLTFSMGDPALTGQVLGGLCMLPFLYRYQVQVYPDFEAENTYEKGVPHLAEMADAQIKDKKGVTLWQITVFTQQ